jgi:peroxiredoxin
MLRHTLLMLALLGCGSKSSDPAAGSGSTGSGSGSSYAALGHKPANARRPTPPPEIDKTALAIGASVPAMEAVDATTGTPWTLASELGNHGRTLIMFYRGDWCPHCRRQLGDLQSHLPEMTKRDIGLVAISVDEPPAGKALASNLKLTFPIISDPKAVTLKAFGVFDKETEIAWASIFVVDKDGKVVHRWLADTFSQRVATEDVLKALN